MSSRRITPLWLGSGLLLSVVVAGCRPAVPSEVSQGVASSPWFVDVTEESGLTFRHDPGPSGGYFLPQIMGSGAALFDYDNDGRLDVYLVQGAGPDWGSTNRLLHQEADGRFRD